MNKTYTGVCEISEEDSSKLKQCMINHLIVYNYGISVLSNNPKIDFSELKRLCLEFVVEKGLRPVATEGLINEVHYLYKKHKRNTKSQKRVIDIQYLTFVHSGERNGGVVFSDGNTIKISSLGVSLKLVDCDHCFNERNKMYINISYSAVENKYLVSLFEDKIDAVQTR